jgi:hypothetical protein
MSQADSEPITGESFAAFATFLGTPLPENPIQALCILRREAAAEIERLIVFLDALGGDPDLEDGNDAEAEPEEPSLGWTTTFDQTSRNRLGGCDDTEDEHDGREPDVDDEDGHDHEAAAAPSEAYRRRLAIRRGERRQQPPVLA